MRRRTLSGWVTLGASVCLFLASGRLAWTVLNDPATTAVLFEGSATRAKLPLAAAALALSIGGGALALRAYITGTAALRSWVPITALLGVPASALSVVVVVLQI